MLCYFKKPIQYNLQIYLLKRTLYLTICCQKDQGLSLQEAFPFNISNKISACVKISLIQRSYKDPLVISFLKLQYERQLLVNHVPQFFTTLSTGQRYQRYTCYNTSTTNMHVGFPTGSVKHQSCWGSLLLVGRYDAVILFIIVNCLNRVMENCLEVTHSTYSYLKYANAI